MKKHILLCVFSLFSLSVQAETFYLTCKLDKEGSSRTVDVSIEINLSKQTVNGISNPNITWEPTQIKWKKMGVNAVFIEGCKDCQGRIDRVTGEISELNIKSDVYYEGMCKKAEKLF